MKNDQKKARPEKLTTTIGDLLKSQGNDILKTEKKPYKKNNKKGNFKSRMEVKNKIIEKDTSKRDESLKKAIDAAVERGDLRADDVVKIEDPKPLTEEDIEIKDGSWEEFSKAFEAEPEPEKPVEEPKNKITINSDYISFSNSDTRIRTDSYKKEH